MSVVVVSTIHGTQARRDELRALMRETELAVAGEPGCRLYRFAATVDDPDEYLHVQEWADRAAMDGHFRGDAFASYQRRVGPLLGRPTEARLHEVARTAVPEDPAPLDPRLAD
jgi:quinol monooxygenase YgiN